MSDLLTRHGPKLAVGGLVALNLVLIGALVLRDPASTAVPAAPVPTFSPSATPTSGTPRPSSTPSSAPSETPSAPTTTPSPTNVPSPSPSASKDQTNSRPDGQPRLLAANSERVAWRATSTDCSGSAVVEVTTDGGRTWSKTKPGLTAIVRLKAYGDDAVFAIGADKSCRPMYAWITGPEEEWQRDQNRVDNIWFRTPKDLDEVHAPGGGTSRPCGDDLVDLAGLGTFQAAALCADGRIRTDVQSRSWRTVQESSQTLSLNADDNEFVSAGTRVDCPGVVVRRFDGDGTGLPTNGVCRSEIKADTAATVVSVRSQPVWIWSGDQVLTY